MEPVDPVARRSMLDGFRRRQVPSWVRPVADLVGVALLVLFLAGFVERNVAHQGDLKTYQLAARVAMAGGDPYQPEALSTIAGHRVFPFVYPPIALLPFLAVADLPPRAVAAVWMWAKIVILFALVFLWGTRFAPGTALLPVALIAVFGWNSSSQWDLASGNIAIVECALVWTALYCYTRGRRTAFMLLIVAAACFKLTPAAFLVLLLVPTARASASPARLCVGLALLGALVLGPTVLGPAARFHAFWAHVPDATVDGFANPSALGLATLLVQAVGLQGAAVRWISLAVYVGYAAAILAGAIPVLRAQVRARDARLCAGMFVFLYVLLMPRPMAYGYVLLTPVPLMLSPRPFAGRAGRLLLSLVLAAQGLWRLTSNVSGSPLVVYAPFLLSLCIWLLVVNDGSFAANFETIGLPGEAPLRTAA